MLGFQSFSAQSLSAIVANRVTTGGGTPWASEWNTTRRVFDSQPTVNDDSEQILLPDVEQIIEKQEKQTGRNGQFEIDNVIPTVEYTVKPVEQLIERPVDAKPVVITVDEAVSLAVEAHTVLIDRQVQALIDANFNLNTAELASQIVSRALVLLKQHQDKLKQQQKVARIVAALR